MDQLLIVIIPACVGAIPAMITAWQSNRLVSYKIDELSKKQEKYNNMQEKIALHGQSLDTLWKRQDELHKNIEELMRK